MNSQPLQRIQAALRRPSWSLLGLHLLASAPLTAGLFSDLRATTSSTEEIGSEHIHTVPLKKQYVPIFKNNKTIAYKTAYFGEIQVGTPRQTFSAVFDTGSGHLILPALGCQSEPCIKHRRFNRSSSLTAVDIEHDGSVIKPDVLERDQLAIKFGMGEVVGEFMEDHVCLGQAGKDCIKLRIVLANEMTEDPFGIFAFDGVLGLGFNALTMNKFFNFFGQMTEQNAAMQSRFAVFLAPNDDGQNAITFGGIDKNRAASELEWVPVAKQELGYWQVRLAHVRIGDSILEECEDGECRAILDTGTSLLSVPRMVSRKMHRLLARPVPGEADPYMDCRHVPGVKITFDLGGPEVSLGAEDYSRPEPFNLTKPGDPSDWKLFCRSLLLPVDIGPPLGPKVFIWGEPVLRKYYTVYDWAERRIGFSIAGPPPEGPGAEAIGAPPAGSLAAGAPLTSLKSSREGGTDKTHVGQSQSTEGENSGAATI